MNSFCFVSETDPEREAALLWGARRADGSAVRSPGQANREGDPKEAGDAQPAP